MSPPDPRSARPRTELVITEISAPGNLAPYAVALSADVAPVRHGSDSDFGTGRFILLYDPEEPDSWGGPFRVVCFAQAPLETDIGIDPFLAEVAWAWLVDALDTRGAVYTAASGTATKILSSGFGELASQGDGAQIELRASWSPLNNDLAAHVEGWGELLCMLAGLPPVGEAPPPPRGPHPAGSDTPLHRAESTDGIDLGPLNRIGPTSAQGRRSGHGLHTLEVVTPGSDSGVAEAAGVHRTSHDTHGAERVARETVGMNASAPGRVARDTIAPDASTLDAAAPSPEALGAAARLSVPAHNVLGVADLSARRAARG
jgi:hypothetical protein